MLKIFSLSSSKFLIYILLVWAMTSAPHTSTEHIQGDLAFKYFKDRDTSLCDIEVVVICDKKKKMPQVNQL